MDGNLYRFAVKEAWRRTLRFAKFEVLSVIVLGLGCYAALPLYGLIMGKASAWAEVGPILLGITGALVTASVVFLFHLFLSPWHMFKREKSLCLAKAGLLKIVQEERDELHRILFDATARRALSRTLREDLPVIDSHLRKIIRESARDQANLKETRAAVKVWVEKFAYSLDGTEWSEELGFEPGSGVWNQLTELDFSFILGPMSPASEIAIVEDKYTSLMKLVDLVEERLRHIVKNIDNAANQRTTP